MLFTDRGSAGVLLSTAIVICSAEGSIVLSASFPEAVWLRPEDSCPMVFSLAATKDRHSSARNLPTGIVCFKKLFNNNSGCLYRGPIHLGRTFGTSRLSAVCVFKAPSRLIEQALIRLRFTPKGMTGHRALPGTLPMSATPHPILCLTDHRKMGRKRRKRERDGFERPNYGVW